MNEENTEAKPNKFDGFVNGATKLFTIGEMPNDPVVKALQRFSSWQKYILIIVVQAFLIATIPYVSISYIKEGRVDDLAQLMVSVADIAHNEGADSPDDVENIAPREFNEPKQEPITPPPNEICQNCGEIGEWKFSTNIDGQSEWYHSCGRVVTTDSGGNVTNW